jgi:hypothetical protein
MPSNAGSVGVDYNFSLYNGNTGFLQDLGDVQSVRVTQQKHDISNRPYNRPPRFDFIPDGYRVAFSITRTVSALEDLAVQNEANFNAGLGNKAGYLNETITNTDGTVSRYQYQGFVFFLTDHGDVSREKTVTVTGEGMASQKIRIA